MIVPWEHVGRILMKFPVLVVTFLLIASVACAQTEGARISGGVMDPTDAVIIGAECKIAKPRDQRLDHHSQWRTERPVRSWRPALATVYDQAAVLRRDVRGPHEVQQKRLLIPPKPSASLTPIKISGSSGSPGGGCRSCCKTAAQGWLSYFCGIFPYRQRLRLPLRCLNPYMNRPVSLITRSAKLRLVEALLPDPRFFGHSLLWRNDSSSMRVSLSP
jgi:hypothetical protein